MSDKTILQQEIVDLNVEKELEQTMHLPYINQDFLQYMLEAPVREWSTKFTDENGKDCMFTITLDEFNERWGFDGSETLPDACDRVFGLSMGDSPSDAQRQARSDYRILRLEKKLRSENGGYRPPCDQYRPVLYSQYYLDLQKMPNYGDTVGERHSVKRESSSYTTLSLKLDDPLYKRQRADE